MPLLLLRSAFTFLIFVIAFSLQASEVTSHPEFPDRWIQTRNELTVEYAMDQRHLVDAVFVEFAKLQEERLDGTNELDLGRDFQDPFSFHYMKSNRDEILLEISNAIGLTKPTTLQEKAYDTFLGQYEMIEALYLEIINSLATMNYLPIWQQARPKEHLKNGAKVPGVYYDGETESVQFSWKSPENDRIDAIRKQIQSHSLKHSFTMDSGKYSASISIGTPPVQRDTETLVNPKSDNHQNDSTYPPFPLVLPEEDLNAPHQEVAELLIDIVRWFPEYLNSEEFPHYDPILAFVILHETAEIGLIDQYIVSSDRRWICDGTANYVAWTVVNDRAGNELPNECYDLGKQLSMYKHLQDKINLQKWPAIEKQDKKKFGEELNRAHYPFATRAIFAFAEEHGENAVADLWKAIGKTPKRKTNMKTVAKAYHKQSRKKLSRLIKEAENDRIP